MTEALLLFSLGIASALAAYPGVAWMRRWAEQRMLDIPNERSSHTRPTPRGGGLLIVLVTLAGLWLAVVLFDLRDLLLEISAFTAGAALIAWISWLDDLRPVANRVRFGAHAIGALLILIFVGFWRVLDVPLLPSFTLGWLGLPITFLWLAGLTNAYNFMDGIDGLAGGQAVVAGLGWFALGLIVDVPLLTLMGALIAGSSLGFLGHNWPPARIFMGDVGSAFLGFTLAAVAVFGAVEDPRLAAAGVLVVWPFVFDTTFTILRRLQRRENIFAAHRSHLYQRLVIAGWSHRSVTLLYLGWAVIGVIIALLWTSAVPGSAIAAIIVPLLSAALLWRTVVVTERAVGQRNAV